MIVAKEDNVEENIKKMLAGEPYTHDGITEFDGLPPMFIQPDSQDSGERRIPDSEYQALIDKFVEAQKKNKK